MAVAVTNKPMADTQRTANESIAEAGRRAMLGLGLDSWNNAIVVLAALAGGFAVLAALATYIAFQLQKQEARDSADALVKYKLATDARIAEAHAQGERAISRALELDREINPRVIDDGGAKEFVQRIRPFAGTPVGILVDPGAEFGIINRIITLLKIGGWSLKSYSDSLVTLPTGDDSVVGMDHPGIAAIQVRINRSRYEDLGPAAKELSIALAQALKASSSFVVDSPEAPNACPADRVFIEIYRKR